MGRKIVNSILSLVCLLGILVLTTNCTFVFGTTQMVRNDKLPEHTELIGNEIFQLNSDNHLIIDLIDSSQVTGRYIGVENRVISQSDTLKPYSQVQQFLMLEHDGDTVYLDISKIKKARKATIKHNVLQGFTAGLIIDAAIFTLLAHHAEYNMNIKLF